MTNLFRQFQKIYQDCRQLLQEFFNFLKLIIPTYWILLLINLPSIIFLNPEILRFNFWIIERLTFYGLLRWIYVLLLFPYLQSVSISYIYNYSQDNSYQVSQAFTSTLSKLRSLIGANFVVFMILSAILLFLGIPFFGVLVLLGLSRASDAFAFSIMLIFILPPLLVAIYIYSKLFLIPHGILLENKGVVDSFYRSWKFVNKQKIAVFLVLLVVGSVYVGISLLWALISKSINPIFFIIYQPFLFAYSVVIYLKFQKRMGVSN